MKIKSIFIISILFFITKGTIAQVKFPVADAIWCYSGYGDSGTDLGSFCFNPINRVEINGKTYSQIAYKPHPYESYQTIYYREVDRKFFVLPQDSLNEIVVYDFNLEVGDTFQTSWAWGLFDSITLVVENVDTIITLDGISRKKITLANTDYYGTWLEGVGSLEWVYVFPNYQGSVSGGYTFTCHAQLNELIVSTGTSTDCDLIDNAKEIEITSAYEVYPNPAENEINIRFKDKNINSLKILNLSGKVVFQKEIQAHESTIQLSKFLETGIYLIQIHTKDGWVSTRKFVKI